MLRGVSIVTPCLLAAVTVKTASDKDNKNITGSQTTDDLGHYKCKPSDLPMYTPLHHHNKEVPNPHPRKNSATVQMIEDSVGVIRTEISAGYNAIASQKKKIEDFINTGKAHSDFIFGYLKEPDNTMPRIGAISIGALSGFIFALRGGFIRKVLYTGIGGAAVASVCYPEDAGKYSQMGLVEAKKAVSVAYNFAYGIKPSDNVNSPEFPKFPTNLSELSDSLSDLAKSAKDAVFSSKK